MTDDDQFLRATTESRLAEKRRTEQDKKRLIELESRRNLKIKRFEIICTSSNLLLTRRNTSYIIEQFYVNKR
jgi:hypothetical protein